MNTTSSATPSPVTAIAGIAPSRDFPALPESTVTLTDHSEVTIRALRKEDAELERDFIRNLSPESRWMRFLGQIREPSDALIRKLTELDYRHDAAFIALSRKDGTPRAVGVSRYSLAPDGRSCECAVTVADAWQGKGLGTILMRDLIGVARQRGIRSMFSIDASGNERMRELARDLGFSRERDPRDPTQVIHRLLL
ncbi:MAG TPA: GNAT family N-acetyltransferase [Rhodanobacteraceae bacterium]|jgi:GNAT superfamily N-acetyltransferase|nr:GNAT family N-acetyltransferase [Rhodanobacteraceae bacterium]